MHVILASIHPNPSPQAIPLAAACLKASLYKDPELAAKISVSLCDLFVTRPLSEVIDEILCLKPDAVGFSLYVWNRTRCLEIVATLRRLQPGLALFAGGPEATADPERLIASTDLNFIITGEGEATFVDAMQHLNDGASLRGVKGIALKQEGLFQATPRKPVSDLNQLPSPYLTGILAPAESALWELSRGCSFACEFCFDSKGGTGVRSISLERIEQELDYFVRKKVTQIFVLDSTFNQDIKRAKAILRRIRKTAPHIHFHFEVRSEFIDAELAKLFAELTCSLQIGLQSADPNVLRQVGRIFSPADFQNRIEMLNRSGAIFGFDLIYGLPGDTLEGFRASLDFALSLYPNHMDIFPLAVLPGTRLAERAARLGIEWEKSAPYTTLGSATFTPVAMKQAEKLAVACDIFYSRGRAVAWFNALVRALHVTPAALLEHFALWLDVSNPSITGESQLRDEDIHLLQRQFLQQLFTEKKRTRLIPLAHDLVDYHYYYAKALLAPPPDLPTDRDLERTDLLNVSLILSDSALLAEFHFEIIDILEAGEVDLREFAGCFKPNGSYAVIYPKADEVFTESVIEPYYLLLQSLRQAGLASHFLDHSGLSAEEATSFLEFAAAEGIVTICKSN